MLRRRDLWAALLATRASAGLAADGQGGVRLPVDFGAHPETRIEWWYVTGALAAADSRWGFQITFFRAATGIVAAASSAFRADQLVFAHAAVTDLAGATLRHDQRIARSGFGIASASTADTALVLRDWRLERRGGAAASRYRAVAGSTQAGFGFDLTLAATQPPLLQGNGGLSRKGPSPAQVSRYYSEPQLRVEGMLSVAQRPRVAVGGRAWLDHEWSDSLLDPAAVGWDWIGMNLDDGGALTAFRLRRADGSTLWAGGSLRRSGETAVRDFGPTEVEFVAGRRWISPASGSAYPVEWTVASPAGRHRVVAVLDDQELDSRASTGSIYWEGLSRLDDADGRTVGRGYLEMTGYAGRLRV